MTKVIAQICKHYEVCTKHQIERGGCIALYSDDIRLRSRDDEIWSCFEQQSDDEIRIVPV